MSTTAETSATTQVSRVHIKATQQAVWDAVGEARVDAEAQPASGMTR
jgi:hypothetical protein